VRPCGGTNLWPCICGGWDCSTTKCKPVFTCKKWQGTVFVMPCGGTTPCNCGGGEGCKCPSNCKDPNYCGGPPPPPGCESGGGVIIPVNKFSLLAPWLGLGSTILVATVATAVYARRVKRRKEKQ
jgi:hypothetical protein